MGSLPSAPLPVVLLTPRCHRVHSCRGLFLPFQVSLPREQLPEPLQTSPSSFTLPKIDKSLKAIAKNIPCFLVSSTSLGLNLVLAQGVCNPEGLVTLCKCHHRWVQSRSPPPFPIFFLPVALSTVPFLLEFLRFTPIGQTCQDQK